MTNYSNLGRKSHPCCTQDAIVNHRQWWNDANGVSVSVSDSSFFSFFSSLGTSSSSSVSYGLYLIRRLKQVITNSCIHYLMKNDLTLNWIPRAYLAIPYMTTETAKPANIISNHTFLDNGRRNAKRLTDFSGALTNRMLIPRSRKGIEKSTTYKKDVAVWQIFW